MAAETTPEEWPAGCWLGRCALIAAVLAGAVLRLLFVDDIEFKKDERWSFERTQHVGRDEPLPWLGMPTSYELRHPGGTVWVFLALGWLTEVRQPTELARACQLLNVGAILLLLAFAWLAVPAGEREPWLWAAALASVNPLAVLLQRKIWPPSVMPAFTMLLVIAWWHRERRLGAFCWGLAGGFIGFLYPAALFLAAGFVLWALLFDHRRVPWRWWLPGSVLGALPLLPWLHYAFTEMGANPISQRRWSHLVEFKFWLRWVTEPFGGDLHYSLGGDFVDFLAFPELRGRPTYLVGLLHLAILGAAIVLLLRWCRLLWEERGRWQEWFVGRSSPTIFTQNAVLWGFGIVITASLLPIHRHYMVLTFPFMFLWLARVALAPRPSLWGLGAGRACLAGLCVVQLWISSLFLGYIHANPRPIRGDYGTPYRAQRSFEAPTPLANAP